MRVSVAAIFHGRFREKWMKRYLIIRGELITWFQGSLVRPKYLDRNRNPAPRWGA
jgi:hypothetical protein